jgi:anti-sigma factor RsiW
MTCRDVEQLVGAFVDTELPPARLLDVARHAATCSTCDEAIRELTELRASVAALLESEARHLDLSRVWPAVDAAIDRQALARPRLTPLRGGGAPGAARVWAALMAIAATAVLWFRGPATHEHPGKPPMTIASAGHAARISNDAGIDRIAGRGITMRREPKSGTMIIWVSSTGADGAR